MSYRDQLEDYVDMLSDTFQTGRENILKFFGLWVEEDGSRELTEDEQIGRKVALSVANRLGRINRSSELNELKLRKSVEMGVAPDAMNGTVLPDAKTLRDCFEAAKD